MTKTVLSLFASSKMHNISARSTGVQSSDRVEARKETSFLLLEVSFSLNHQSDHDLL